MIDRGGYYQAAEPTTQPGTRQAKTFAEAAIDSEEQRQWRTARDGPPQIPLADSSCTAW